MGRLIVLIGPTGSGKTTQAAALARHLGYEHFSSGQLLRDDNNPEIIEALNRGELAPDGYIQDLVAKKFKSMKAEGAVMDGFPRTMSDVKWLEHDLPKLGFELSRVLLLQVGKEESINRLMSRGRADDNRESMEHKWEIYQKEAAPIVSHYQEQGMLVAVNGEGTVDEVAQRVIANA